MATGEKIFAAGKPIVPGSEALLSVYPNPARGKTVIRVAKPSTVTVYDMRGNPMIVRDVAYETEVNNLSPGVYMVRSWDGERGMTRKVVVVD